MRIQVTLTSSESKRLVAKGVANLESVKRAFKHGIIVLSRSTTNAYVYEELTGQRIEPERYCCGIITTYGTCISKHVFDQSYQTFVLVDGKPIQTNSSHRLPDYVNQMDSEDIFIKSGNVLDSMGVAATIVGDPTGGEIGQLKAILAKDAKLIVPVTINKTIPLSIEKVKEACGIEGTKRSMGMPITLLPLPGLVVTELDAIKLLTGANTTPISTLDTEGKGTVTLTINGSPKQVEDAWKLLSETKGETPIMVERIACSMCPASTCHSSGRRQKEANN